MKKTMYCFLLLLFVCGCTTTQTKLSPMQIRQITNKSITGNYENVYRAAMTVLQDQGYVMKNTDMNSGLIVANMDRETSKGSQFWQAVLVGGVYNKGTFIEVTLTVNKISQTMQELRINIQETTYSANGGKQNIKQIYDPKIYEELTNQIRVEVKRREALEK